jgi:hypothetical protein
MLTVVGLATAQTFGLSRATSPQACLAIGNATYQLVNGGGDVTLQMGGPAETSDVLIGFAATPDEADFIFVDDGTPPACQTHRGIRKVAIGDTAPDLTVAVTSDAASAQYRIYVRSASVTSEMAAALFAASRSADIRHAVTGSVKLTRSR